MTDEEVLALLELTETYSFHFEEMKPYGWRCYSFEKEPDFTQGSHTEVTNLYFQADGKVESLRGLIALLRKEQSQ